jgi:uncharacterized protein (DUF3820 family)
MKENYQEYMLTKLRGGKYKGYFVKDVPDDYLRWAVSNLTDAALATMFSVELQRRNSKLRKQ